MMVHLSHLGASIENDVAKSFRIRRFPMFNSGNKSNGRHTENQANFISTEPNETARSVQNGCDRPQKERRKGTGVALYTNAESIPHRLPLHPLFRALPSNLPLSLLMSVVVSRP